MNRGVFEHECFEFYECWRVCFLFSTTNYMNLDRVGCSPCIRVIRIDSCEARIELFLQLASQPHSKNS